MRKRGRARATRWACAAVSCAAAVALAGEVTSPSAAPVVPPATLPAKGPLTPIKIPLASHDAQRDLPEDLAILATRSMFVRGHGGRAGSDAAAQLATARLRGEGGSGSSLQSFVLRGVARQGVELTAFIEDVAAQSTRQVHVGDDVAGGRVVAITTDGVDHAMPGLQLHVTVGQALDGTRPAEGDGASPASQPSATQPAVKGGPAVAASDDDVAAPVAAGAKILPTDKP